MATRTTKPAAAPPPEAEQDALPGIGHNAPPDPAAELRESLRQRHAPVFERAAELLAAAERVPAVIDDDATQGRAATFIAQLRASAGALDKARKAEKEPYLEAGRTVDATFNAAMKQLLDLVEAVTKRSTDYLRRKAEAERQAREAAAQKAAEEARRQRQLAEEAARKAAETSSVVADIQAKRAAVEAEQAAGEAEDAARSVDEAKPSDLARTRSDSGSTATLATVWTFRDLDVGAVDLEALRPHLPVASIEQAIRAFIRAGGRTLAGVVIEQQSTARVR